MDTIHVFERAGLGKAPFRLAGTRDTADGANAQGLIRIPSSNGTECWTTPGGTCEYCGRAIIVLCYVRSADGRRFVVGSDCVAKTGDAGLRKAVARERQAHAKAREERRIQEARARLEDLRCQEHLASLPHPRPETWQRPEEQNLLAWAQWMMTYAGHTGRLKAARKIEEAMRS